MALRNPNRLRLVDCDLPDDVERQLSGFEDEFDAALQPYFAQLDALVASDLPGILAALEEGIALREELLQGAPVLSLSSLQELEDNLALTNPQRNSDEETTRIDERKVGAAGIALITGRMFRILSGTRVDALRALWYSAGGDYDAFVVAGNALFAQQSGTFSLYETNPSEQRFPLVNKSFDSLFGLTGYGPSVFIYNLFWNGSIATTTSNRLKLNACGFSEEQIVNIMSGQAVNADYNFAGALTTITNYLRDLASLVFKPADSPLRMPRWQTESMLFNLIATSYFEYRTKKATNSYILDASYFGQILTNLRAAELKELFEQRPEIHDIEVPPVNDALTLLVSNAVALQPGTLINTYMTSLPEPGLIKPSQLDFECKLFNIGFVLWRYFLLQYTEEGAASLELQLRELRRTKNPLSPTTTSFCGEFSYLDPGDYASVLGSVTNNATSGLPPVGITSDKFMAGMRQQNGNDIPLEDPSKNGLSSSGILIQTAVDAVDSSGKMEKTEETKIGSISGLPTKEGIAQILARKISWPDNFVNCTADANLSKAVGQTTVTKIVDMNTGEEIGSTPLPDDATPQQAATYWASRSVNLTGISDLKVAEDKAAKAATDAAYKAGLKPIGQAAAMGRQTAKDVIAAAVTVDRNGQEPPTFTASAVERRSVQQQQGRPYNSITGSFVLENCSPLATQKIGEFLEKNRKKLQAWLVRIINVIQELIVYMQDKIDSFLLAIQLVLDNVLSKLEKVLSIDVNLNGKIGFENSLIKCAWGVDFGIKLDLLGLLLQYLGSVFASIGLPLRKFLGLLQDFMNNIFCIPIRMFEAILGSRSALIGAVGCTVKDFRLPVEIEQLLSLITGTFELRGLVLRTGVSQWFDMTSQLRMQQDEFGSLTQFASVCQSPKLGDTINSLSTLSLSNAPIAVNATPTIDDILGKAFGLKPIGATLPI